MEKSYCLTAAGEAARGGIERTKRAPHGTIPYSPCHNPQEKSIYDSLGHAGRMGNSIVLRRDVIAAARMRLFVQSAQP